jgi:hypothetical protein
VREPDSLQSSRNVVAWLESLRADAAYGWRQLKRRKVTSAAAILSLALGIGACASAFRLIDAALWRPLPVARPEHLYFLSRQGIGVAKAPFSGTEPGTMTDIFVPAIVHPYVTRSNASVFRVFAVLKPGMRLRPVREKLEANARAFEAERATGFVGIPEQSLENFLNQRLLLEPARTGVSHLQNDNRRSLAVLGVLVALVLLIACANVANLMTAQTAARREEMALRISIGAARSRLVQLVLVESAWIALLAAAIGALFAWWSAPFVVSRINPMTIRCVWFFPRTGGFWDSPWR